MDGYTDYAKIEKTEHDDQCLNWSVGLPSRMTGTYTDDNIVKFQIFMRSAKIKYVLDVPRNLFSVNGVTKGSKMSIQNMLKIKFPFFWNGPKFEYHVLANTLA